MRERKRLAGALMVKAVSAVTAMMLPVREGKGRSASHADVGINPLGGLGNISHQYARDVKPSCQVSELTTLLSIMLPATVTLGGN